MASPTTSFSLGASPTNPAVSPPGEFRRRSSKACEHCRAKRTRCSGTSPCEACVALGLGDGCYVRDKARPRRAPAASKRRKKSSSPNGIGPRPGEAHAHFVRDVELAIDSWLESTGNSERLSLPGPSRLSSFTATALPADPSDLAVLEDRLLVSYRAVQHFEFLSPSRVADLYARHRDLPESLVPDQRALLASVLCLGRLSELSFELTKEGGNRMRPIAPGEAREDVTYFRMALGHLDAFGAASCTALCALHCLHLFAQIIGGPEDTRELLGAMAWQARELGLHRRETAAAYPAADRVGQLFFSTMYKDTWFATLVDAPPFTRLGEYDYDPSVSTDVPQTQGILSRLAVLESELLSQIHSGRVDTTTPDFVLSTESRWWPLMRECGDERNDRLLASIHPYADIRFNWIRLLLRAPCLSHPTLGASSTPIVARSLSRILHTYASLAATDLFHPCYAQLRRIVTCGQLLVLCHTARELGRHEAEELFAVFLGLVKEHRGKFDFIPRLIASFESVGELLGLVIPAAPQPAARFNVDLPIMFDYSLPTWFDTFYEPHLAPEPS
ncbi:hypothetical protein CspHIS471_0310670 [Cutaneotrichosporon sp. HIS471]|nr:hypothetical protein CspHIS471_0310670 [Cutaneotrichosporon sp. HIS471]